MAEKCPFEALRTVTMGIGPAAAQQRAEVVQCKLINDIVGWEHNIPGEACTRCAQDTYPKDVLSSVVIMQLQGALRSRIVMGWRWDTTPGMKTKFRDDFEATLVNAIKYCGQVMVARSLADAVANGFDKEKAVELGKKLLDPAIL